ncbi:MAG: hypothetical protein CUN57_03755, partial [Phototrophicales bacterium]
RLADLDWRDKLRLRELYFTDQGEFVVRYYDRSIHQETEKTGLTISEVVRWFFDDILENVMGIG